MLSPCVWLDKFSNCFLFCFFVIRASTTKEIKVRIKRKNYFLLKQCALPFRVGLLHCISEMKDFKGQ